MLQPGSNRLCPRRTGHPRGVRVGRAVARAAGLVVGVVGVMGTVGLVGTASGCAAPGPVVLDPPPATSDPNRAPADFSLGVTVFEPRQQGPLPEPTRFVLEPDGVLRAAFGAGASGQTFPLRTRPLTREQVDTLYRLAREAGLFERPVTDNQIALSNAAATIQTSHRLGPAAGAIVVTASVSGAGERLHHGFQPNGRAKINPVIDALSRLVWADGWE